MTTAQAATKAAPKTATATNPAALANQRRASRRAGKKKLVAKLRTDREFAKTYFEAKSKRSTDKKSAFRKKKSKKK